MIKIILFSLLFCSSLLAREPAIEPTFGLSIDDVSKVSPKDAKGFNFGSSTSPSKIVFERSDFNGILVLFSFLIITPMIFLASLTAAKKYELKRQLKDNDFVVVLEDYRKSKEEEEKDNIKKAG